MDVGEGVSGHGIGLVDETREVQDPASPVERDA